MHPLDIILLEIKGLAQMGAVRGQKRKYFRIGLFQNLFFAKLLYIQVHVLVCNVVFILVLSCEHEAHWASCSSRFSTIRNANTSLSLKYQPVYM